MGIFDSFMKKKKQKKSTKSTKKDVTPSQPAPKKDMKKLTSDCKYDASSGEMIWKRTPINPGDFIKVDHEINSGYTSKRVTDAGIFLGIEDDNDMVLQVGVRQEHARLNDIKSVKIMARMDESEG